MEKMMAADPAADEESKFRSLLIRISKLLSKQNVEQLVFVTMNDINNRSLSEEFETSGNALKIFQAMMERDLYTFEDPSLLIQHLKLIGRNDAVKMLEQETGASPSYSYHSSEQLNQGSRERIFRPAALPNQAKPGPQIDPQATHLHLHKTQDFMASVTQPNDVFNGVAFYPDKGTNTTPSHIQVSDSKRLEPEASLLGDSNSPGNLPDIPDTKSSAATTGHIVQCSERKFLFPESKIPEIPERPHQGNRGFEGRPENKPEGSNRDVKTTGDPVTSLLSTQTAASSHTACYQNIPERPPRGSSRDTSSPVTPRVYSLPLQESQGIFTAAAQQAIIQNAASPQITLSAVPQQISHTTAPRQITQSAAPHQMTDTPILQQFTEGDTPNGFRHSSLPQQINQAATPVTICYVYQQPIPRHGLGGMSGSRIEVETLQGARAPPIPPRPPRGRARADNAVTELELSQLSRRLDAQDFDLFGHKLGFDAGRISQLRYDSPHDISRAFYRLMVGWRNRQQSNSNMKENLASHLRNIECVGLASDVEAGLFSHSRSQARV